jgi:uncharacterized membrane-anchored protein YhcB (DUF1043 family)
LKKIGFIITALICIAILPSFASGQNLVQKPTIESLQNELAETNNKLIENETQHQNEINQLLLQREKDIASGLYNFVTIFIIVITFFVTVAGIIVGVLINKLTKHQKKIDLVLDSQEFDTKVSELEMKLASLRLRERENLKSQTVIFFNQAIQNLNDRITSIDLILKSGKVPGAKEIAEKYEYDYHKMAVEDIVNTFKQLEKYKLEPEDDEDEYTTNSEEELLDCYKSLKRHSEEIEKIHFNVGYI